MAVYNYGSSGDGVKQLQTQLTNAGYNVGPIDGIYGDMTQSAVNSYQTANMLSVDGIAGSQTLGSLSRYPTTLSSNPATLGQATMAGTGGYIPFTGAIPGAVSVPMTSTTPPAVTPPTAAPTPVTLTNTQPWESSVGTPVTPTPAAPTAAPTAAVPEWQLKLNSYATDQNSAIQEVLRAKQVYATEKADYDAINGTGTFDATARAKQISHWADQVRAAGKIDDATFGKGVTLQQAQTNAGVTPQPSAGVTPQPTGGATSATGGTVTDTTGDGIPDFNPPPETGQYESVYAPQIKEILDEYINSEYESPYTAQLKALIEQMNPANRKFAYDPAIDPMYQQASKQLTRQVMEIMNQRGILNSTITENQIQQGLMELMPQYQSLAYDKFMQEGDYLMKYANFVMGVDESGYNRYMDDQTKKYNLMNFLNGLDDQQYERYKDARDTEYNRYLDEYNAAIKTYEVKQQQIRDAWDRTSNIGWVDAAASIILGVPVGTLSKAAREEKNARADELADAKTALTNEANTRKEDYQYQLKLDASRAATAAKVAAKAAETKAAETTSPLAKKGTAAQVSAYYQLYDIYMGGGSGIYKDNPKAAYDWLISHRQDNVKLVGEALYQQLLTDVKGVMATNKSYDPKEEVPTVTEEKYTNESKLRAVIDSYPDTQSKLDYIQENKENIISMFGASYYNTLKADIEEE